jgi:plasmid maintenance system antidote protein VapI
MKMGPKEFALRAGKPEKTIIAVLKGDSSITADMAVQFENITRIPAQSWMDHQRGYDEFIARKKREAVIRQATPWAKQFPLEDMIQKGWLPQVKTLKEKTMEMLSFFGFSNHKAWEEYYFKQQLKVAFRISLAQTKDPYAVSAWLRQGEIQALELTAKKYSEKKFKEILGILKSILENHNDISFNQLQILCLEAGVKVVKTPSLNNAPISGATRWLSDTPLIQLTDKPTQIDHFWFTFFHEVGHILLHGKKDVFLENLEYSDKDNQKEIEADEFARKWM